MIYEQFNNVTNFTLSCYVFECTSTRGENLIGVCEIRIATIECGAECCAQRSICITCYFHRVLLI